MCSRQLRTILEASEFHVRTVHLCAINRENVVGLVVLAVASEVQGCAAATAVVPRAIWTNRNHNRWSGNIALGRIQLPRAVPVGRRPMTRNCRDQNQADTDTTNSARSGRSDAVREPIHGSSIAKEATKPDWPIDVKSRLRSLTSASSQ